MPLVKTTLETSLNSIFDEASILAVKAMLAKMKKITVQYDAEGNVNGALAPTDAEIAREFTDNFVSIVAPKLANAIDAYIKTATVITNPGQAVVTAGTPTAQSGATTSPGTGTIT